MRAPEVLKRLARDGLREIAARKLKARWPRLDAVFYQLDAIKLFRGRSMDPIQETTFEIGMLGRQELAINDPQKTHVLSLLTRKTFSEATDTAFVDI